MQTIGIDTGERVVLLCLFIFMLGVAWGFGQQYKERDIGKRFRFGLAVAIVPALIIIAVVTVFATN